MIERRASIFLCDEVLFTLTGKVTISGMYTSDILLPAPELPVAQLIVFFTIETPKENLFKSMTLRVVLPGDEPRDFPVPITQVPQVGFTDPRRKRMTFRQPFVLQQITLRPGRIQCSVIHESGELDAGGVWVTPIAEAQAAMAKFTLKPKD